MARVRPFVCVRPAPEKAARIAALPYDVYNRAEAKAAVAANPDSFLAIDRAETSFPDSTDTYAPEVYAKARDLFRERLARGDFVREDAPAYFVYEQTMDGRVQTGVAATVAVDDYTSGTVARHENTRAEKEEDRVRHVDTVGAQTGPIFLAYRRSQAVDAVVEAAKKRAPLYDFVSEDGIRHRVFAVRDAAETAALSAAFAAVPRLYIADGHHRAASAVRVGLARRAADPSPAGDKEYNWFLSVLFPDSELKILDYNRAVKDLNGLSREQFLAEVAKRFDVSAPQSAPLRPSRKGEFSMLRGGEWRRCSFRAADMSDDPVDGLDVSLLQKLLLDPVLGIKNPKTDSRIDFIGGIRGLGELERRTRTDCAAAFAMHPTSMAELFAVADAGRLMPPKSTWFEPKLRSGLFIHEI